MERHYQAIAKIVGGVLNNNERLNAMVNTLINYFETEDIMFNSQEFRSACFNGDSTNDDADVVSTTTEGIISPSSIKNEPDK